MEKGRTDDPWCIHFFAEEFPSVLSDSHGGLLLLMIRVVMATGEDFLAIYFPESIVADQVWCGTCVYYLRLVTTVFLNVH